jgi:hypothetical protein
MPDSQSLMLALRDGAPNASNGTLPDSVSFAVSDLNQHTLRRIQPDQPVYTDETGGMTVSPDAKTIVIARPPTSAEAVPNPLMEIDVASGHVAMADPQAQSDDYSPRFVSTTDVVYIHQVNSLHVLSRLDLRTGISRVLASLSGDIEEIDSAPGASTVLYVGATESNVPGIVGVPVEGGTPQLLGAVNTSFVTYVSPRWALATDAGSPGPIAGAATNRGGLFFVALSNSPAP